MGMLTRVALGAAGLMLVSVPVTAAAAAPAPSTVSVGCGGGSLTTITDGVNAVADGGTVNVCAGTYSEDVIVWKAVTLVGAHDAVVDPGDAEPPIDPELGNNAFTVVSPNVTIRGFTVQHATGDGIFVLGDHALVQGVLSQDNAVDGINVDGSSWSVIRGNTVTGNGGGIELANDPAAFGLSLPGVTGTASHDTVVDNNVVDNPFACGIFLVDHGGGSLANGIHDNLIKGNQVVNNAMEGYGAGILLAGYPSPGGVWNNTINDNVIAHNGLAGVTVHSHSPGQYFGGNVITGNDIGLNNSRGQEFDDQETTGIFLGSKDALTMTVSNNTIHDDVYGIFLAGDATRATAVKSNRFVDVTTPVGSGPYVDPQF